MIFEGLVRARRTVIVGGGPMGGRGSGRYPALIPLFTFGEPPMGRTLPHRPQ
jgi:hypothetical protein